MDFGLTKKHQELGVRVFNIKRWQGCWYITGLRKKDIILESMWLKEAGFLFAVALEEEKEEGIAQRRQLSKENTFHIFCPCIIKGHKTNQTTQIHTVKVSFQLAYKNGGGNIGLNV